MNPLLLSALLASLGLVFAEARAEGSNYQLLSLIDKVNNMSYVNPYQLIVPGQPPGASLPASQRPRQPQWSQAHGQVFPGPVETLLLLGPLHLPRQPGY